MSGFAQDFRYALRGLSKSRGFAVVAVLMLAVGIGVNAAVFTVTNAILFRGFPAIEGNDRLVYIAGRSSCCVSYPDFEDWRTQATSFEALAAVHGTGIVLSEQNNFAERYDATEVSAGTFKLLGQRPILGRDFLPSDEVVGALPVTILSYGFWERRYAKDPGVVGRTLRINDAATTVIGIMPRGFSFPQKQDVWLPLVPTADVQRREARNLWFVFGRLTDGATIESARAEMEVIGSRLARAFPRTNQDFIPRVRNFHEFFIGTNENVIYASMWGAVGFVLLIACANLANLTLARAIRRSREVSIRIALGAGRWRIVRQLLIESVILSSLGGVLGWWMARWTVPLYALAERGPGLVPWRILDYTMDYRILLYLAAVSVGTGLLFGLFPALRLSRLEMNASLKDGGRGTLGGRHGKRLSGMLVTAEIALAVVLLAGAGVMIRSLWNVSTTDAGVNPANVLTALLQIPEGRYSTSETQIGFYDRLKARVEAMPGVESFALASQLPTFSVRRLPYELAGVPPIDERSRPMTSVLVISPSYFRTLGTRILAGRDFNETDRSGGVPAAIVNQRFANTQWPGFDPLGKRLRLFDGQTPDVWVTVVGVAPNIVQNDATRQTFDPLVYLPYAQAPKSSMWVISRSRVPPASLGAAFRYELRALDADLPIWIGPSLLSERLGEAYWNKRLYGQLFLIFAAIALVLASVGLYAVVAHSVSERTQEIGIRMALGATARQILTLVFQAGILQLGTGLAIGLTASVAINRLLQAELVQVSPSDPLALVVASATLIVAAALGCLIPARRATRVDPLVALRYE